MPLPDAGGRRSTAQGAAIREPRSASGLEPILRAALVIFAAGALGAGWAVFDWAGSGFGPIHYNGVMRVLVMSLTAVAVAIQLAAAWA